MDHLITLVLTRKEAQMVLNALEYSVDLTEAVQPGRARGILNTKRRAAHGRRAIRKVVEALYGTGHRTRIAINDIQR